MAEKLRHRLCMAAGENGAARLAEMSAEPRELTCRYQALSEHARDSIMFFDREGRILDINRAALQIYGYGRDEMVGMNVSRIRAPETACLVKDQIQQALNTGILFETLHRRKDGTVFPVEVNATAAIVDDERVILSIVRDISERVKANTELRKLSTAVHQSPCSVVITDLEGNIEYVNPKFTAATGYTPAEAIGQNPRVLKSGHQPPEVYKEMWETIVAGREWQGEFQNKCKNGSVFWELASISPIRDAEGKATHYLAIKEDITPRKQVEDMIHRDMELASRIQRGFLPSNLDNDCLTIHNIYQPHQHVGGDLFDYSWDGKTQVLSGYLADVMGHGVGTALQAAALRVLFHQAEEKHLSVGDTLRWVNSKVSMYFAEDTFAAAIYFQLDFKRQVASFSVAGINHLFAWSTQQAGLISKPGMYLGILPDPEYEEHAIAFQSGDSFLFLTDGLFDLITDREGFAGAAPGTAWSLLNALLAENKGTDDASALKIIIK